MGILVNKAGDESDFKLKTPRLNYHLPPEIEEVHLFNSTNLEINIRAPEASDLASCFDKKESDSESSAPETVKTLKVKSEVQFVIQDAHDDVLSSVCDESVMKRAIANYINAVADDGSSPTL